MDIKIIDTIFKIGNIFGLTPCHPEKQKTNSSEKAYVVFLFVLYTVSTIYCLYNRQSHYATFSSTQLVLRIILDCVFYCHTCDSLIGVMIFKRSHLLKIFKNLRRVEYQTSSSENYFVIFIVTHILRIGSIILYNYLWISIEGFTFFKMYFIEDIQILSQCFHVFFAYVVLRMLLVRYRHLASLMRQKIAQLTARSDSNMADLSLIKRNLFILKQVVCGFNAVFGWTILTYIFFGVTSNLMYIDTIIKTKDELYRDKTITWTSLHILFICELIISFWVAFVTIAMLCDMIQNEHSEVVTLSHKLEILLKKMRLEQVFDVASFIGAVSEYQPSFTAARFFTIGRSSIFSVLNSIVTFLLVMIQFQPAN